MIYTDLDVHVALLSAPSYQKHMVSVYLDHIYLLCVHSIDSLHPLTPRHSQDEKYYDNQKTTAQVCRQYVDLFGIINKIPNALGKFLCPCVFEHACV